MKNRLVAIIQKYDIAAFLVITFGWAWVFYIAAAIIIAGNPDRMSWLVLFQTPGAAAPLVAGLVVRYARGGNKMVREGWQQYRWQRPTWQYVLAVGLLPAIAGLAALFSGNVGEPLLQLWQSLGFATIAFMPLLFLLQLPGSPLLEEYGWRGYLLPRLQSRFSAFWSSVVIGILWGLHHVPIVLAVNGSVTEAIIGAVAPSILMAWLFNSNKGGMLPVLLFHASLNIAMMYIAPRGYAFIVLTACAALLVTILFGYKNLSQHTRTIMGKQQTAINRETRT